MSAIRNIVAKFECEACGEDFTVQIDPAWTFDKGESVLEMAEEAVRADFGPSVQDGMPICTKCTKIADNIRPHEDEYQPTRDEILHATGAL